MDLIIWLITPPNNIREFIYQLKGLWNYGKVIIIASHSTRPERKNTGYLFDESSVDEFYVLDTIDDENEFIDKMLFLHKKDIHVFGGLRNDPAPIMYRFRKMYGKEAKIVAFTEKPALHSGNAMKRMLKNLGKSIIYRKIYKRAMDTIDYLLVVGNSGIRALRDYGWSRDNIYNFMYSDNLAISHYSREITHLPVKFLYVGRFDYDMRGLDTLMNACRLLSCDNWTLTLIGGYGKNKDEVILWAESDNRVSFGGTWPADEVQDRMCDYDVYICPAKEDSWNGQINMALTAGLGVITTDQAGSDELVNASGAGLVISKDNPEILKYSLERAIMEEGIVDKWKKAAREYSGKISANSVAKYFCEILKNHYVYNQTTRIDCPWL